jgi:hypothetical protein
MLEYGIVIVLNRMRHNQNDVKIFPKVHSKHQKPAKMNGNQFEKKLDKITLGLLVFLFTLYNIGYWRYYW